MRHLKVFGSIYYIYHYKKNVFRDQFLATK